MELTSRRLSLSKPTAWSERNARERRLSLSKPRLLSRCVLLGMLAATLAACAPSNTSDAGEPEPSSPETDSSVYDATRADRQAIFLDNSQQQFAEQITLSDGRKVRLWYAKSGSDLMEQHYSPAHDAWTAPVSLHTSDERHPCQGIDLVEEGGVVAALAHFGLWCFDGEEMRMDSLALVGTGDLTDWAAHSTTGAHRWNRVGIGGGTVTWTDEDARLTWTVGSGFDG